MPFYHTLMIFDQCFIESFSKCIIRVKFWLTGNRFVVPQFKLIFVLVDKAEVSMPLSQATATLGNSSRGLLTSLSVKVSSKPYAVKTFDFAIVHNLRELTEFYPHMKFWNGFLVPVEIISLGMYFLLKL